MASKRLAWPDTTQSTVLMNDKAIVLFSGGQDSTTCLLWALKNFGKVEALNLRYGQSHAVENTQAAIICTKLNVELKILDVNAYAQLGRNALTDNSINVSNELDPKTRLPNTFVPGRNLLFLTLAGARAYQEETPHVVGGMCQEDYSGYPDCRRDFIDSAERTLSLAMDFELKIHTPLMYLSKAATWKLAATLDGLHLLIHHSHTCYKGVRNVLHPWGYGCGECPACELRKEGYYEAFGSA